MDQLPGSGARWTGRPASDVTEDSCRDYLRQRVEEDGVSRDTAGRELGVLRAAIRDGAGRILASEPKVWVPKRGGAPKDVYLTRDEIARLTWELWQGPRATGKKSVLRRDERDEDCATIWMRGRGAAPDEGGA